MNVVDVRAQLEQELTWREDELRFFHNILSDLRSEDERNIYRKSLVTILYSHFEGFTKAALSIYVQAINDEGLPCEDAHECLAAASLEGVFSVLRNPTKKSPLFKNQLPDDTKLHQFARDVEAVARLRDFLGSVVSIEADRVVRTDSNLSAVVMRKNLYKLGFPPAAFQAYEGKVQFLLIERNGIAHGTKRAGVPEREYEEIRAAVRDMMRQLLMLIARAVRFGHFRKQPV